MFYRHHYLSCDINKSANCWLVFWNNKIVAFISILSFPGKGRVNAWRGHRTVVLPEFQGIGIGSRISDEIGQLIISGGGQYYSKTTHPSFGEYREKSSKWRATSKNKSMRKDYLNNRVTKESKYKNNHAYRLAYSHEYIGGKK